jgi:hypothetical protein
MSSKLAPRIPRSEAVGHYSIEARLYDVEEELDRVDSDLAACVREYRTLDERRHFLVSEHVRLCAKLALLEAEEVSA